jgi:uncharacterized membrane protein YvlD (DUF360 family)
MSGATAVLIKLGVRLVVFTAVFWIAAKKNDKIVFAKKWTPPLVAFVFAVLNTVLYWLLTPVLELATLGALGFAMPFIVNALLLYATVRIFRLKEWSKDWFKMDGLFATLWMATFLTLAHGVLWFALDYIPKHV